MRPVTKPNPIQINVPGGNNVLAYAYHTALSLDTNVNFGAGSVPTSLGVAVPYIATVNQLLNILLEISYGNHPYPAGNVAQTTKATNTIKDRLTNADGNPPGYRAANPQLDARLGNYCSFCEIYKPGHEIDVEHRLPKTPYPVTFVWWGNFLQACSRCNSTKGQHPQIPVAQGFVPAPQRANPYPFEPIPPVPAAPLNTANRVAAQNLMQKVLERHFWPDLDPRSFRRITYQMQDSGNGYAAIPSVNAAIRMNNHATFYNYAVTAHLQLVPPAVIPSVATEIVALRNNAEATAAANAAAAAAAVAAAAAATVALARTAAGGAASNISPAIGLVISTHATVTGAATVPAVVAAVNAVGVGTARAAAEAAHQLETDRTLNLTGLNVQDSARAGYRTEAWFSVLAFITLWENNVAANNAIAGLLPAQLQQVQAILFNNFWPGLLSMAKVKGFYSTLIELLLQIPHPAYAQPAYAPLGGFATLAHRFIFDSNPANAAATGLGQLHTIPGTNVTFIP